MRTMWLAYIALLLLVANGNTYAFAQPGPTSINISGALFNPNGTPINKSSVDFKLEVWDENLTCVLYSEEHLAVNLSVSSGRFSLLLGRGQNASNNIDSANSPALTASIFNNSGIVPAFAGCASGLTLAPGDQRLIRISYNLGNGYTAMNPDVPLSSSAYAMVADSIAGKKVSDLVQIRSDANYSLTQENIENVFSKQNFARLDALLNGSTSFSFNSNRLTNVAAPLLPTDAANKDYVDQYIGGKAIDLSGIGPTVGDGKFLMWDATAGKWSTGLPDGASLSNVNAVRVQGYAVSTQPPAANQVLKWNGSAWTPSLDEGGIAALTGDVSASGIGSVAATITPGAITTAKIANAAITSAKIANGATSNLILMTDSSGGSTVGYSTCPNEGEVLKWTVATGWQCTTVASLAPVTSVAGKTGAITLNTADIDGLGTAALYNHGTNANEILRLDASARVPAVDGGLLTNVSAQRLQGRALASTTPTASQVLAWNAVSAQWEPTTGFAADGSSSMTGALKLVDGTAAAPSATFANDTNSGLFRPASDVIGFTTGGAERLRIDSNGNIGIGTSSPAALLDLASTTAGFLMPRMTTAQRTAMVSPSTGLQVYDISDNQIYYYNGTAWQALGVAGSGVTSIIAGTGLSGGTITSTGTIGLANTSVTAGVYGSATQVPTFTVDAQGRLTAAANVTITGTNPAGSTLNGGQIWVGNLSNVAAPMAISGDATLSNTGSLALTTTGVTAGSYTKVTVDAKGRVTNGASIALTDMPSMAANTIVANATASAAVPTAVTLSTLLDGYSNTQGSVIYRSNTGWTALPAGTSGQFLQTQGSSANPQWANPTTASNVYVNGGNTFGANANVGLNDNFDLGIKTNNATRMTITAAGNVGVGTTTPTARLHLAGGLADPSGAPLKISQGSLMTNPEAGAIEFDGTGLYFTDASDSRHMLWSGANTNKPGDYYSGITYTTSDGGTPYDTCLNPTEALMNNGNMDDNGTWGSSTETNSWIQADLGSSKSVVGIEVGGAGPVKCWGSASYYWNVSASNIKIQTSLDGSSWTDVATGAAVYYTNSPQPLTFTPTSARYIRIFLASGWLAIGNFRILSKAPVINQQWTASGSSLLYSGNAVGIGTASPNGTLTVAGSGYGLANGYPSLLTLAASSSDPWALSFTRTDLGPNSSVSLYNNGDATTGKLSFWVGDGAGSGVYALDIDKEKVLVKSKLEVNGAIKTLKVLNLYVDTNRADDTGDGFTMATAKKTLGAALNLADSIPTSRVIVWIANSSPSQRAHMGSSATLTNKTIQITAASQAVCYIDWDAGLYADNVSLRLGLLGWEAGCDILVNTPYVFVTDSGFFHLILNQGGNLIKFNGNDQSLFYERYLNQVAGNVRIIGDSFRPTASTITGSGVTGSKIITDHYSGQRVYVEGNVPSNFIDASVDASGVFFEKNISSLASGNVGIGTTAPVALLDLVSSTSGFLMPRMTSAQRTALVSPATGLQVYDTTGNQIYYYNGTSWQALGVAGSGITSITAGTGLSGGTITTSGTIGLANTTVTGGSYGSATQVPTFTVDAQGRLTAAANVTITGTSPVGSTLTGGQIWVGNSSNVATAMPLAGDATLSNTGSLTLSNSGVTSGTYTKVTVDAKGRVTSGASIALTDMPSMAANTLIANATTGSAVPTAVTLSNLLDSGVSNTQGSVLYRSGTGWVALPAGTSGQFLQTQGSGANPQWATPTAASNVYLNGGNSFGANATIGLNDNFDLGIKTNNATRMTVTAAGNVGIGSTTPTAKLVVEGSGGVILNAGNLQVGATPVAAKPLSVTASVNTAGLMAMQNTAANGFTSFDMFDSGGTQVAGFGYGNSSSTISNFTNAAYMYSNAKNIVLSKDIGTTVSLAVNGSTGNVGIGTTAPAAILDVNGTGTQSALIVPRDTTANRPTTPVNGMIRYNTTTPGFEGYANGAWGSLGGSPSQWTTSGSNIYYNTGNVGIGTTSPTEMALSVGNGTTNDGGFIAKGYGTVGTDGATLTTAGAGTRMIWYPKKAAFRVGAVYNTQWDDANIGSFSFASGIDTKASSSYATAMGYSTTASGNSATAMGYSTTASGNYATAMGYSTLSSGGFASTSMGFATTASGYYSTAMGNFTTAASQSETVIGQFNVLLGGSASSWVNTDPLFVIGNGTNGGTRSNAMTVLKNGNVGIGSTSPTQKLDVSGTVKATAFSGDGSALTNIAATDSTRVAKAGDTMTGALNLPAGTAAAPSLGLTSAGLYSPGTSLIGLATAGTERVRIDASGNVGIGTTTPNAILDINGTGAQSAIILPRDTTANRPTGVNGMIRYNTSNSQFEGYANNSWSNLGGGGSSQWTTSGSNIYYNTGTVAIGATPSTEPLYVVDSRAGANFTAAFANTAAGDVSLSLVKAGTRRWTFGMDSADSYKFKFAMTTGAASYATDSKLVLDNNGNVGIGTATPASKLELVGSGTQEMRISSTSGFGAGQLSFYSDRGITASEWRPGYIVSADNGNWTGRLDFYTNGTTSANKTGTVRAMSVVNGTVGIGTTVTDSPLHVAGNIRATGQIVSGTQTITAGTSSVDFNNGNVISTDYNCASAISFANLRDGGTYTLIIRDVDVTMCTFNAATTGLDAGTMTYRFSPANGPRTANSHTIYTLLRAGTTVYVSWGSGF